MGFFNEYRYSVKATFFSAFFCMASLLFIIPVIYCFSYIKNPVLMALGIILSVVGGVFTYLYLGKTLADKIAEKDFKKKITSNVEFAYEFCKQNPENFESVAEDNPEFSEKYRMESDGNIYQIS